MTRQRLGWQRDPDFDAKRRRLAESMIKPRHAAIVIAGGLAFLFATFVVAPTLLFESSAGLLMLVPLMVLYAAIARVNSRLLGVNDESDDDDARNAGGEEHP